MTVLTWSDDRVEQLKKLWEGGLSASQIAAELGNVTRNAGIGKVHRLGLSRRATSPSSRAPPHRPRHDSVLGGPASPPGAPRPAHDGGGAPGVARQHRARARFRSGDGAG